MAGATIAVATQSDHTGPILTFVGALLVAVLTATVTAITTDGRQERQIAAAAEQQRVALAAEERRQAGRLAHERELHDVGDVRKLLDDTLAVLATLERAVDTATSSAHRREDWMPDEKDVDALETATEPLLAQHARLVVRLGYPHRVPNLWVVVAGSATGLVRAMRAIEPVGGPSTDTVFDTATEFTRASGEFKVAATALVPARLPIGERGTDAGTELDTAP